MNIVLDETPANVENVEMFDDYAAQGVIDRIPGVEARMWIPRKKRNVSNRRRRDKSVLSGEDIEVTTRRRMRRPNVRLFDQ